MATSDGQPQLKAPCDLRSEGAFEPSRDGGTYECKISEWIILSISSRVHVRVSNQAFHSVLLRY